MPCTGVKDIRKNQLKAATDRLAWAQSPTFLAGLTASVLVADIIATPKDIKSIVTYALCYTSLLTATLSATLSALAAVYMQQQRWFYPLFLTGRVFILAYLGDTIVRANKQVYLEQSSIA